MIWLKMSFIYDVDQEERECEAQCVSGFENQITSMFYKVLPGTLHNPRTRMLGKLDNSVHKQELYVMQIT